jgi:hypothetical protein
MLVRVIFRHRCQDTALQDRMKASYAYDKIFKFARTFRAPPDADRCLHHVDSVHVSTEAALLVSIPALQALRMSH